MKDYPDKNLASTVPAESVDNVQTSVVEWGLRVLRTHARVGSPGSHKLSKLTGRIQAES